LPFKYDLQRYSAAPVAKLRVPGATVTARLLVAWSSADDASLRNMEGIYAFADPADTISSSSAAAAEEAPFALLLVSDNNLSAETPTQIVKFRVVGGVYAEDDDDDAAAAAAGAAAAGVGAGVGLGVHTAGADVAAADRSTGSTGADVDQSGAAAAGEEKPAAAAALGLSAEEALYNGGGEVPLHGDAAGTVQAAVGGVVAAVAVGLLLAHQRRQHSRRAGRGSGGGGGGGGGGGVDVESALVARTNAAGKLTMGNYSYGLVTPPR
jgi:hypothetical protein